MLACKRSAAAYGIGAIYANLQEWMDGYCVGGRMWQRSSIHRTVILNEDYVYRKAFLRGEKEGSVYYIPL